MHNNICSMKDRSGIDSKVVFTNACMGAENGKSTISYSISYISTLTNYIDKNY
jgi:hypothetical protein